MKKLLLLSALSATLFTASAQLQLPQPSPHAVVTQTIGYTDITIDYSCPAVKGRTIWGELVPYDKLWRAGANAATKITFSKDVTINGGAVPKGSYSIFMIPGKTIWTVILNKDATASTDQYKQESDLMRFEVTPQPAAWHERLTYGFYDFTGDHGVIAMEWDKLRIAFVVDCPTDKQAVEAIEKATGSTWQVYNNAARYYLDRKEYDKALGYANQSVSLSEQWFNTWVKAQCVYGKGDAKTALTLAAKAKELGDKNPQGFFFKTEVEKALVDWKAPVKK